MNEMDRIESRRGFMKAVGLGTAAVAAMAATAPRAEAETVAPARWDKQVDILVLGGGAGGVIAGYVGAKAGVKTLVVEAGAEVGGTALISSGSIHAGSIASVAKVATKLPTADPIIASAYIKEWLPWRDKWIHETGAPVKMNGMNVSFGGASFPERQKYFQFFHKEITRFGGEITLNTRGVKLYADPTGKIVGALAVDKNGKETRIGAKAVILATGGWTNNKALRSAHWGQWADRCTSRAVPYNLGDGLLMALEHGAQTTNGFSFFYGHVEAWPPLVPEDPAKFEAFDKGLARDLLAAIQNFSASGLFINYEGKRFVNENGGPEIGGRFCEAILRQTKGHVFLVVDANDIASHAANMDMLKKNGLVFEEGATIEALADKLAARGVHKANFLKTIAAYKATPADQLANMDIPKTGMRLTTMSKGPFTALQITAAPSASFGGVKINTKGQVIGMDDQPIAGLYATACCAGGFFYNEYGGSLGASSVFGKVCAETALSMIK